MLKTCLVANRALIFAGLILAGLLTVALFPTQYSAPVTAQQGAAIKPDIVVIAPGSAYKQTNLVSDVGGLAFVLDPLLVNPWGISATASSPFWVANNGTSTTQLIRGDVAGAPVTLNASPQTVTIPGGLPTGTVANPVATEFVLPGACASAPCGANFLFASITGNITGWDPNAPAAGSTTAVIAASQPGHVYTGLAYGNNGVANFIYAADFANGTIDVFNTSFALQPAASFPFVDPTIPTTMGNTYHPFNIQAIGTSLYVTYAKVGADGLDEAGVGNGFVRRFNTNGVRDLTFGINNGALNSPWGVAIAPATFGIFGSSLLIGNFGEGNPSIHAYSLSGAFQGTIQDESGNGIVIDGLWALTFGNGGAGGDPSTLYFAAGIGKEEHGLFGSLKPTTASATSLVQFATDEFVIGENTGHIDISVIRAGDASGTATVNVTTYDQSQPGHASQKSDYEIALAKVTFNPGETSKSVRILLVNDNFVEGDETINLALSNPTGAGLGLGSPNSATVKVLDDDSVPLVTVIRSATGSTPAAITAARDLFRSDIGGGTVAGANGSFGGARREINWDGVPAASSAPNNLAANFFNTTSPRGVVFSTNGTGFQVSGATTDAGAGQPAAQNFGNINATYTATFQQFSAQRLFTPLGSNTTDINFFVPGTTTPATVTSFGAVFTDVDTINSTRMQFFDVNDVLITEQAVPPQAGSASLSFFGITISNRPIARVRIITQVAPGLNDNPALNLDAVVMDDFIYSEPVAVGTGLTSNPIDDATLFVRQQYLDFLNREPDAPGLAFWTNEITSCGVNAQCTEVKRISVSGAFFLSIEFQKTGLLSYLTNRAAFGTSASGSPAPVLYGQFEKETQQLQKDLIFGQPGFDAQLEANKVAYFNNFITRPEFVVGYPSTLTNEQYVDNLLASAGLSPSQVRFFAASLTNSQEVPPTVPTLSGGGARPASFGTAKFQFNPAQTAMTFTATINNIDVTGTQTADTNDNLTNAHIHAGASVAPGVNGPVVWGFFGAPFNDNNPNDAANTPFASPGVGGTFSGKWDAPEGNATTLAAQLTNLRTGKAYINFHTTQFGGGEIRGNFPAEDAFRNSLVAGLNAATLNRAQVLRAIAETEELQLREFNSAFVAMEYFGYLRRDPDTAGFNFWLNKLNAFNGNFINAELVKGFISSFEYRRRFGPI